MTELAFRDRVHGSDRSGALTTGRPAWRVWMKTMMNRLQLGALLGYHTDYTDFTLWETLFTNHLPQGEGLKVIQIGSAPWPSPVQFHTRLGYNPYGTEYSDIGVQPNRQIMNRTAYAKLSDRGDLAGLFCNHCDIFGWLDTPPDSRVRHVLRVCKGLQAYGNVIARLVFRGRNPRSRTSPRIVYIGRKLPDRECGSLGMECPQPDISRKAPEALRAIVGGDIGDV